MLELRALICVANVRLADQQVEEGIVLTVAEGLVGEGVVEEVVLQGLDMCRGVHELLQLVEESLAQSRVLWVLAGLQHFHQFRLPCVLKLCVPGLGADQRVHIVQNCSNALVFGLVLQSHQILVLSYIRLESETLDCSEYVHVQSVEGEAILSNAILLVDDKGEVIFCGSKVNLDLVIKVEKLTFDF